MMDFNQLNELNAEVQNLKLALEQYTSQTATAEATEFEQGFRAGVIFLGERLGLNITEIERQVLRMLEEVREQNTIDRRVNLYPEVPQ